MNTYLYLIPYEKSTLYFIILLFSILLIFGLGSCDEKDDDKTSCDDFHWAYEGEASPDTWSNCFNNCGGQSQSI